MTNTKSENKSKINPMTVGAAVAAGIAGAAVGAALADKRTRDKIVDKASELKNSAVKAIEDVKESADRVYASSIKRGNEEMKRLEEDTKKSGSENKSQSNKSK